MSLSGRLRGWIARPEGVTARVEDIQQLPPSLPDGRQYRYEFVVRLTQSVTSPPDETDVRDIAEEILAEIETIDDPEWEGADEIWVQVYAPDRPTDAGACGTVHWLADEGIASVGARSYMFPPMT